MPFILVSRETMIVVVLPVKFLTFFRKSEESSQPKACIFLTQTMAEKARPDIGVAGNGAEGTHPMTRHLVEVDDVEAGRAL